MDPTASIRKLGFRKWYERQLYDCHAALVTCLLCGLTVVALLEQVSFERFGWRPVSMLATMIGAAVLGWFAWRRYITVLQRAERYGEHSTCPACQTYARFVIEATGLDSEPGPEAAAVAPLESAWLRVRCRMCSCSWRMPD